MLLLVKEPFGEEEFRFSFSVRDDYGSLALRMMLSLSSSREDFFWQGEVLVSWRR